ncbi:hypothetical protein H2198_005906 [Neophaeococcomyces mojaviensis]|uniref:Uncharacterized protein n=1 Tax=Neophaeococcomyces mojaviensis TaxID=3383035 RepID=A0ACC3A4G0_9EURO|nr:hypothetical protein H2198_005906 [Knufia sp. JES_112]
MFSVLDQENLATVHQTTAAGKPLNQTIRALQPRTPATNLKTPFRSRNDENKPLQTGKAIQNAFVTPGPWARAPLGAKTTNAKAQAFQTPGPLQKTSKNEKTVRKLSTARRSAKRKIYVAPEETTEVGQPELEDVSEPESGYTPPPIEPLPDPPMDFNYDTTYACLKPENFTRGVGGIYFQSPKDEHGFPVSLKKEQETHKQSLQDDLDKILQEPATKLPDPDEEVERILAAGPGLAVRSIIPKREYKTTEADLNTLRSRVAASKLSHLTAARVTQLPAAATRETASSKQKRKSTFAVSRDANASRSIPPPPVSRNTIGFPRAKKLPSIIPKAEQAYFLNANQAVLSNATVKPEVVPDQPQVSPRKFVELYGEPPVESEMWFKLKELEIRDRRREDDSKASDDEHEDSLFDLDEELDSKLAVMFDEDTENFKL